MIPAPSSTASCSTKSSRPSRPIPSSVAGLPAGLVADADGVLRGNPNPAPGTYPLTVTVTNSEGSDIQTVNLELIAEIPIAAALDVDALDIAAGSTTPSPWFSQAAVTHDTVDAARSAAIGHNALTTFKILVNGPGTVSFWWKVEAEDGFDFLYFSVDGLAVESTTGLQLVWEEITRAIPPGVHELSWTYEKDANTSHFADAGWVDEITFTGYAGWIAGEGVGGRAGLHIDAEHDGYTNIEDYFFDQGAMTIEPHNVPALSIVGGNRRLTIPKRSSATDVGATVKVSTDLSTFSTTNTNVVTPFPHPAHRRGNLPGPKAPRHLPPRRRSPRSSVALGVRQRSCRLRTAVAKLPPLSRPTTRGEYWSDGFSRSKRPKGLTPTWNPEPGTVNREP